MPKSKTQAQKKAERDTLLANRASVREQEKAAAVEAWNKKRAQEAAPASAPAPSKQEARKLKKAEQREKEAEKKLNLNKKDVTPPTAASRSIDSTQMALQRLTLEAAKQDVVNEKHSDEVARLVANHSTCLEGLRPILSRLQKEIPEATIIPGPLSKVAAHAEELEVRYQRTVANNTYTFVARYGTTAQDVSIVVSKPEVFDEKFVIAKIDSLLKNKPEPLAKKSSAHLCLANYNRAVVKERTEQQRVAGHKNYQEQQQKQKDKERNQRVQNQIRKLKTKVPAAAASTYAERDVDIINGKNRTPHSLK